MTETITTCSAAEGYSEADRLWLSIEELTTEACILRKEGAESSAAGILGEQLPPLLMEWAKLSPLAPALRREKLKRLIAEKQSMVDSLFLQRRLIVDEMLRRLRAEDNSGIPASPVLRNEGPRTAVFGLKRRVPFADISGMIEAVNESIVQQERDVMLPVRAMIPHVALS